MRELYSALISSYIISVSSLLVLQWQGRCTLPLWFCQAITTRIFFKYTILGAASLMLASKGHHELLMCAHGQLLETKGQVTDV